jgi:hypothetical protein
VEVTAVSSTIVNNWSRLARKHVPGETNVAPFEPVATKTVGGPIGHVKLEEGEHIVEQRHWVKQPDDTLVLQVERVVTRR